MANSFFFPFVGGGGGEGEGGEGGGGALDINCYLKVHLSVQLSDFCSFCVRKLEQSCH